MRHRGAQFWLWTDTRLPHRTHEEVLGDGVQVEVRARVGHEGITQVFIGVYDARGIMLCEEFHDRGRDETYCAALKWGALRAGEIVAGTQAFVAPHRVQLTLGTVITDESVLALRRMEMNERERFKLSCEDAWSEYLTAKAAMLDLMRAPKVDPRVWADHKERLKQAIDRRVCVQRAYLR
ncbi:hypothetical protein ACVK1X_003553 [Pseudomonas sp. PvR086]|jgi:hypothetical protein|uniref:hypothetical protein n=1 Tax=Pseudomonas TaxID=286 RepID=UPI000B3540BC|nr:MULTISPECIES: hypothetical protein [Pseudomonas]MBD9617207.1 hypothetical protein [Pseudomonas sp. PDM07]PMY46891.1 hypothetical protein C1X70_27620 [Pseudomonas sp. FW305-53]PMY84200.1 hypothetical protein C1X68_25485 [Pseudomonas sp. FW303-C2]PMY90096.1 hypothetical protein C1X67_25370 [Pseudomonas sp. FW305-62]PNA39204.1 hypothetical protein C1X71_26865 [Pseudomonas sp. FW306-2-2C-A10BC]